MIKPKRDEEAAGSESSAADIAAVDSLLGGESAEPSEAPAAPIGPPADDMEDEEGEDPAEAPETDEAPPEDPEVLVSDLRATIDKLERALGSVA